MSPVFRCYELHSVASRDTFFFFYFARGNLFTRSFNDFELPFVAYCFRFDIERRKLTKVLQLFFRFSSFLSVMPCLYVLGPNG